MVLKQKLVVFGEGFLSIEDVVAVAGRLQGVALSDADVFVDKVERGCQFLEKLLEEDGAIYGVTTGFGDSVTQAVPLDLVDELSTHLSRFHGCGLGNLLSKSQVRAVLVARLCSLCQGMSGVRLVLIELIVSLINADVLPRIPEEGSVGASGDLTPLSYLAAVLMGEREVFFGGALRPTGEVFSELGLQSLKLKPKEGLAVMNGTAVMTGLACLAFDRAQYLSQLVARITSMVSVALKGNVFHFDEALFAVKPHVGQARVAGWIRSDLAHHDMPRNAARLQDQYSVRCAPHVIGVLEDALPLFRQFIENELNSANDNPIIDGVNEHVLHGGHFYGGHIAFAMDSMKNCVANLADLLDRQLALLVDPKFNHGLPANLSGAPAESAMLNHGFKAVQIACSAWTAEALKLTMPASVFSRSTECHNQDKVSMGTIAARDCLRVLELSEQVAAACLLAVSQGVELRLRQGDLVEGQLTSSLLKMKAEVFGNFEFLVEDRPLESSLREFVGLIQCKQWELFRHV